MDDLDFTVASTDENYSPSIARTCFDSLGQVCNRAKGEAFFAEKENSDRMYLLLEGKVRLFRGMRVLDIARAGDIFGDMGVITGLKRSAWAVALMPCKALSLDLSQFLEAIRVTPEFALMLMKVMINRLRLTSAILNRAGRLATRIGPADKVFDRALVKKLASATQTREPQSVSKETVIMREGETGDSMYIVLSGQVSVMIEKKLVEYVGAGGVFGEMALVDASPRSASAIAQTDVRLLPINRDDFMTLVNSNPWFAVSMLRALAARLARLTIKTASIGRQR